MASYRRRKPFIVRFFGWVMGIALVLGIGFCGLWGYLYFGKNVELVGAIGQVSALNTGVNEVEYIHNAITESDETTALSKTQTQVLNNNILIYDREFGALINNKIKQGLVVSVGSKPINLQSLNLEVLEVNFLPSTTALTSFNIKFKLSTESVKESLSSFPFSLLKGKIPETIYVSATADVMQTVNEAQNCAFHLENATVVFNSLSPAQSQNILNLLGMGMGFEAKDLPTEVCQTFMQILLGTNSENGIYQTLSTHTPQGFETTFSFKQTTNGGAFEIAVQPAVYTVEVRQKLGNNQSANVATITGTGQEFDYNSSGEISVSAVQTGYNFLGWYTAQNQLLSTDLTLSINNIQSDLLYFAHFDYITKTITYNNLLTGANNPNPATYNISSGTFSLLPATCVGYTFLGWWTAENGTGTKLTEINASLLEDVVVYAHWRETPDAVSINLSVDGKFIGTMETMVGASITPEQITQSAKEYLMAGYEVKNWYTNSAQTTLFTSSLVSSGFTVYGTSEYFTQKCLFYPYKEMFDSAVQNNSKMTFSSRTELVAWIDYVVFYHIKYNAVGGNPTFKLTYISGTDAQEQEVKSTYHNDFANLSGFQTVAYSITYNHLGFFISPASETPSSMATLTADSNRTQTQPQQDATLLISPSTKRANSYDNFKINQVTKTIDNISNSEQLVRVLEQGYRPVCVANSPAEKIYNQAKSVLREICNDNMTDAQKLRAIYEWLVLNVQYDHLAANTIQNGNDTRKYKAWFAEGVFEDKLAVCEGFAKATVIMAKIEGIPAVMVTGNNHAWNKVLVNGNWYQFDATHGNLSLQGTKVEALSYATFLFNNRPSFVGVEYTNIATPNSYNIYENISVTYNSQTLDLNIDSQAKLANLLKYVASSYQSNVQSTYFSMEFATTTNNFSTWLSLAETASGLNAVHTYTTTNYLGVKTYLVLFEKPA